MPRQPPQDEFPVPDAAWKRSFRRRLLEWYDRHARDLPWRRTRDPYHVWVSEVMLQQTQVATVVSYFERFVAAFPTIADLAAADEQQVLRLWEGLGYYRRARQLHAAARLLVERHDATMPRDPELVHGLPGVGRYTAGAILSIAFDAREPIVEANTIRLYSRLLAYRDDPRRAAGQQLLWHVARDWLPQKRVGAFNQALMELGSEVCLPRAPRCGECPVADLCRAHAEGIQERIPVAAAKPKIERVIEAAVVVRRRRRVLLCRTEGNGRWGGLWDFPRFPVGHRNGTALTRELREKLASLTGVEARPTRAITTLKHGVTRFRITLVCHEAQYLSGPKRSSTDRLRWVDPRALDDYPLNVTGRKLARLIA